MSPGPAKQFCVDTALDAAIELFRGRGFNGVSTNQLMAAMGIGKKSLYDTFGCKRELLLTALRRYAELSGNAVREQLSMHGGGLAGVRQLLGFFATTNAQTGVRGCLIGVNLADFDATDHDVSAILTAALDGLVSAIAEQLQLAQTRGELAQHYDPQQLARLLICTQQGMTMVSRVDHTNAWSAELPTLLMTLLQNQPETPAMSDR